MASAWRELDTALDVDDAVVDRYAASSSTSLSASERMCLNLIVQMLKQVGRINEAAEIPLIVALTVSGIVPDSERFCTASETGADLNMSEILWMLCEGMEGVGWRSRETREPFPWSLLPPRRFRQIVSDRLS